MTENSLADLTCTIIWKYTHLQLSGMVFLAVEEGELQCVVCVCVWPGFPLSDKQCTIQLENKYNKNYKNMPLQLQIVTGRTFRGWISRSHPQEIKQLRESLNSSRILFEAACQVIILSHYQVLSKNFLPELSHSADLDLFCLLLLQEKQGGKKSTFIIKIQETISHGLLEVD